MAVRTRERYLFALGERLIHAAQHESRVQSPEAPTSHRWQRATRRTGLAAPDSPHRTRRTGLAAPDSPHRTRRTAVGRVERCFGAVPCTLHCRTQAVQPRGLYDRDQDDRPRSSCSEQPAGRRSHEFVPRNRDRAPLSFFMSSRRGLQDHCIDKIPVAFLNLPGELSIGAVRVLILARMRRASASCPRRGFFGLRPVATKFRPPYRPGAGEDTRTVVMNEAGGFDDVNLLKALGAEALGAPAFDEDGPNEGNDVREPKLVVFSGGTAFNSVAAGTLWWCGMVLLISTEPRSTCTHVISQLAL